MERTMWTRRQLNRRLVCQGLTFGLSVLKLFCPELLVQLGKEVSVDLLANLMDPKLIPWVLVLNILGYWLKKLRLPKFLPPLPVLLFAASFVVCCLFGWAHTEATGAKAMIITIMDYGIVNGLLVAFFAISGYDILKGFMSRKEKEGK